MIIKLALYFCFNCSIITLYSSSAQLFRDLHGDTSAGVKFQKIPFYDPNTNPDSIYSTRIDISDSIENVTKSKIEILPILSYDTDAGFGYGIKSVLLNLLHQSESFDLILFNSTKGEHWYQFKFSMPDYETRQGKVYPLAVDVTVDYDKWIGFKFFGVGNKSLQSDEEKYTREPFDISFTLSRGFISNFVGQVGIRYRSSRNYNFSEKSKLIQLAPDLNASIAKYTSLCATLKFDTRNSFINPSDGLVFQSEIENVPTLSFSNVAFTRLSAWFQYYKMLFYPELIFAFRACMQNLFGDNLPIQVLLPIGGNKTLRGSVQDRYLDKTSALMNAELRFPLIWWFGGVVGFDAGKVWNGISKMDLIKWVWNPVVGLRIYIDRIIVRLDFGFGRETTGFYLNFDQLF